MAALSRHNKPACGIYQLVQRWTSAFPTPQLAYPWPTKYDSLSLPDDLPLRKYYYLWQSFNRYRAVDFQDMLANFIVQHNYPELSTITSWRHTDIGITTGNPQVIECWPIPVPTQTCTHNHRYRFPQVWVCVAQVRRVSGRYCVFIWVSQVGKGLSYPWVQMTSTGCTGMWWYEDNKCEATPVIKRKLKWTANSYVVPALCNAVPIFISLRYSSTACNLGFRFKKTWSNPMEC